MIYSTTMLPATNDPAEISKCFLDLLKKLNDVSSSIPTISANGPSIYASGSNSNGSYIQFADGTIIEWAVKASVTTSVADGAVYINSVTVTFPIAFVGSLPIIITGSLQNANMTWGGMTQGLTLATTNIYVVGPANSCSGYPFYIAVGKWK